VLFLLSGTAKLRLIFWAWVFHCGYHEDDPISQSRQRFDEFASYTSTQTRLRLLSVVKLQITVEQGRAESATKDASPVRGL